ncbi:hypothetical protein AB9P05_04230 [Roseivirga sp. BDSF3-8]|uniref:hypothetical protein n=1 Tax=Roseivirga sp. BDSF3-8 TaxID=3241598 RepID=UPI003531A98D
MENDQPPHFNQKMKTLRVLSWIFMGIALVIFYLSLRSRYNNLEYTIAALAAWGVAFVFHHLLQKEKKKFKE